MNQKDLEERLIRFSVLIIQITGKLRSAKSSIVLENQMLRSCTSCSLNYGEVIGSESSKDFEHKLQVVLKELRETYVALRIIKNANLCKDPDILEKGIDENNQLISIFVKSLNTHRNK